MSRLLTIACAAGPIALLYGCVSARPVALPNGTQGYDIRYHGAARDISD